ncbi:MAG: amino acid adenylation domain-containing protein, partial [Burkholderiales bacterium]|nr:amino acid adenylation domain-containing protein [Burkholderiales bacterium]
TSIQAAFRRQVAATPQGVALVQDTRRWAYAQLDRAANRLAHRLRRQGSGRGSLVAFHGVRGFEAVTAMLAILKIGAAYVPLDPEAPEAHTAMLLGEAGIGWLVGPADRPPPLQPAPRFVAWEVDGANGVPGADDGADQDPGIDGDPDDLAYVLHTSGSTGRPKGVCTPHRGVLRLVLSPGYVELGADEVVLQAAPLSFDASTFEIWGALLNGGTLAIQGGSRLSLDDLARTLREQRVTTLWLTAGLFNLVVDERIDALSGVRQLLAGGDVLSVHHVRKAQAALPGVRFVNGYGPTETTTFACCHRVDAGESAATIPIGRPIGQTRIHVLDAQMVPVPVGAVGELYVGGAGVARGYLDRPDLTAEVFVPNPFFDPGRDAAEDCALVLYRTGDRVRMRSDGAVEFVGRRDDQVKLRGFRIEPAEIEQVLGMHPAIQDASVIVSGEAGDRRLVAYVVPAAHAAMPPTAEMRRFAADRLPDYMVPATFVTLSALPLSTTGKVDRRALPAPAWDDAADATSAARTALEATLVAIWSSLLPAAAVGVHDNFFDLGGDSILAMQLASRAARAGLSIAPAQVFEHQTIAGLAAAIERQGGAGGRDWMETGERPSGDVPLTPIQRWFFDQALAVPSHFNQAVCVVLPSTIERAHVVASIAAVVSRHDAFRLRFEPAADGWRQHYAEADAVVPVEWFDVPDPDPSAQDAAVERHANALQAGLDLVTGPLMRIGGFDLGPQRGLRLLLVVHHLIIDGVSWRTLLGELQQAYLRCRRGQPVALGPKPRSWRAWAEWLSTSVTASDAALAYWRGVVDAGPQVLPLDGPGGVNTMEHAQSRTRVLDESLTHALLHDVPALRQWQPQELLLAALATTLTDWIGAPDVLLDLEFHGRPSTGPDFTGTIGWFTALFPLRLARAPTDDPQMRVSAVQSQLRDVPDHGCSYGILRGREGGAALAVTPPIAFNYLGRFDGA